MLRYVKIIGHFVRLGILNELEYRINFFLQIFQTMLALLVSLGGISIIFDHTTTLNGWRPPELLAVIGVYFIVGGIIYTVVQPSLQRFMEDIRTGSLDFTFIKPVDSQLLVSVKQIQIWKVFDIGLGFLLIIIAVRQLEIQIGLQQATIFVATLFSGGIIAYCMWLLFATLTFWFVRIDNILVIFDSLYEAGRWPVGIYPGWLRFMLTFLIPIAFAVTVPAEALIGRLTTDNFLISVGIACMLLIISRQFWKFGVRNYTGASA